MAQSASAERKPIIFLDRSRSARGFSDEESLWHVELDQILGRIHGHLDILDAFQTGLASLRRRFDDAPFDDIPVLSLAIFGTYGSGKTSVLWTLKRKIDALRRTSFGERDPKWQGIVDRIYCLPVLKPNLLTENDHFLYSFLANALEEDRHCNSRIDQETGKRDTRLLTPVQQRFQEVSEYLQVIDTTPRLDEYDPLGVSLDRLERHTSDIYLQQKLRHFIDALAGSLAASEKSVILLPVDDAELSYKHLANTLDTFRRYLGHPRLVPVFSFMGRMVEELTAVKFDKELKGEERRAQREEKNLRTQEQLSVGEQIALQYLSKMFPVRNRIRLGPAYARVQKGYYIVVPPTTENSDGQPGMSDLGLGVPEKSRKAKVIHLLEAASLLLFGHAQEGTMQKVRLALRPSSLRSQLQVLDAMIACGVDPTTKDETEPDTSGILNDQQNWLELYGKASWSLLNCHRETLNEYGLYLDDLYASTRQGLQRDVLDVLLSLDMNRRQKIMNRWVSYHEDLRSQTLSLLAAAIFRPLSEKEEYSGDDPNYLLREIEAPKGINGENKADKEDDLKQTDALAKYFIWNLKLWMGFYLPLALHFKREGANGSVKGVSWNFHSAPGLAIRTMLENGQTISTGMMRVSEKALTDKMKDDLQDDFYNDLIEENKNTYQENPEVKAWLKVFPESQLGHQYLDSDTLDKEFKEKLEDFLAKNDKKEDWKKKLDQIKPKKSPLIKSLNKLHENSNKIDKSPDKKIDVQELLKDISETINLHPTTISLLTETPGNINVDTTEKKINGFSVDKYMDELKRQQDPERNNESNDTESTPNDEQIQSFKNLWNIILNKSRKDTVKPSEIDDHKDEFKRLLNDIFGTTLLKYGDKNSVKTIFKNFAEKKLEKPKFNLLVKIWFFFGNYKNKIWAAASVWRGMSLVGQLLELGRGLNFKNGHRLESEKRIYQVIERHISDEKFVIPIVSEQGNIKLEGRLDSYVLKSEGSQSWEDEALRELAGKTFEWLAKQQETQKARRATSWKTCPVRRLHGDSILNELFYELDATFLKETDEDKSESHRVKPVLARWTDQMVEYLSDILDANSGLSACPFLEPLLYRNRKERKKAPLFLGAHVVRAIEGIDPYGKKEQAPPDTMSGVVGLSCQQYEKDKSEISHSLEELKKGQENLKGQLEKLSASNQSKA